MLMGVATAINMMAVDYTAKANLLLKATGSGEDCEMYLRQSNAYGDLNGFDMYMSGRQVALYAVNGTRQLELARAANFTNVYLGLKTDNTTSYKITVSGVEGEALVLYDLFDMNDIKQYPLVNNAEITFSAPANSTIENRFVINYTPAPTCDYSREGLVVGRYYTICLPYAVENPAGASFWNMSKRNAAGTLAYLEEVEGGLEAGKPYIFQAEAASLCFEYSGEEASAGTNGVLVGTFEPLTQTALNATNTFLLYNNELYRVDGGSGNSLGANRAYINYNAFVVANEAPQSAPGRRVRAVPMQANGTTGIENLNVSEAPAKMIIDGKMFIIRGEQMFDATGRLVK